jgi:hypothetical protein
LVEVERPYVWVDVEAGDHVTRVGRQRDGDTAPLTGNSDLGLFGFPRDVGLRSIAEEFPEGQDDDRERDFVYVLPRLSRDCILRTVDVIDPSEAIGINTPDDLERAASTLRSRT